MQGNTTHELMEQINSMLSFRPGVQKCNHRLRCSTRDELVRRRRYITQTRLEQKEQNLNQRVLSTGQIASRNMPDAVKKMTSISSGTQASTIMLGGRNLNSMDGASGDITGRLRNDNILSK